ncbi:hypothetical protein BDW22DRAFT_383206 [Trametopsis cervina]|nr:hypothetical protein BDW22DRAFT_383206 [Trametopsis cervina]
MSTTLSVYGSRWGFPLVRVPLMPYVNPNGQPPYFHSRPPIDFSFPTTNGSCLITLQEALDMNCPEEWNTNVDDLLGPGIQRISCRVNWPGFCPEMESVNVRNFQKTLIPLSKAMLARNVARAISKVLEKLPSHGQTVPGEQGQQIWTFE